MPEPVLPTSKTALDRLGAQLAAGDQVSNEDLEKLAKVVDTYQQVLDDVKEQLARLGHQATTRVKTTGTLIEKLRRQRSTRLSQVQDLAGARIIVSDRPAQDEALTNIRRHFEAAGHACKEFDRRKEPSHGYRAVHIVVHVGPIPVEVQIRTELEDTWAQIVERLADQRGRGIRYGEVPDNPDAKVSAGGQEFSRREAMTFLIELGDAIASFELTRGAMLLEDQILPLFGRLMTYVSQFQEAQDQRPVSELPADERAVADMMAAGLAAAMRPQIQGVVTETPNMTVAQMFEVFHLWFDSIREENDEMLQQVRDRERELRDTLQLIAAATGE